jgi:AbrB family looped-hinge helix DNA binding protein
METVTITPKFQVVIPKDIRDRLKLRHLDRIELVPVRSVRKMKGFLRGIDTAVPRERDRL